MVTATVNAPDGGWGWVIVASSFMIHVLIDGMTYSFGVLAAEFVDDLGSSRQLNGWITSVMVGVILGAGPVVSLACDRFGNRAVSIGGAALAWAGFAASYFVTRPWMFILTISLVAGFGISLIYLPAIVCVGVYFEKRRSTAIGIAVCGSGLGIFAFGPFVNYLIDEYTWRGAVLILAGVVSNSAVFGALLRPPLPPAAVTAAAVADADDDVEKQPLTSATVAASVPDKSKEQPEQQQQQQKWRKRGAANDFQSLQELQQQQQRQKQRRPQRQQCKRTFSVGADLSAAEAAENEQQPQELLASQQIVPSRSAFIAASTFSLAEAPASTTQPSPQQQQQQPASSSSNSGGKLAGLLRLELMRDPVFLLLLLSNLLFNVGFDAPFLYAPDRAKQAGYSTQAASLLLSVIGAANLIGRLAFGFVSDCQGVHKPALYASALTIAGVALFFSFLSSSYAFMAVYCAVFGVFVGAYITLTPVVLAHLLGPEKLNDSFGLTLLFQGIGVLSGPPMAGALFDHTQDFNISYMASGSFMMLSGIILFPLPCLLRWQAAKKGKKTCTNPVTSEL